MRYFLFSAILAGISLLRACGKKPDAARELSRPQPSATAVAVQSSTPQTPASEPVQQETTRSTSAPPSSFKEEGACPFEGCTYRQWKTEETTAVHEQPEAESAVVFSLQPGEWVTAISGFVLTAEPGIFELRKATKTADQFELPEGAKVYLYTYHGEGDYRAWFNGRFFDFELPGEDEGELAKEPKSAWWAHLRNSKNQEGWTSETKHFSNVDQLGGPDLSPSSTVAQ